MRDCNISRANILKFEPKLDENMAELIGHLHGDGGIFVNKNKSNYIIHFCSNDFENIERFENLFENCFDYNLKIKKGKITNKNGGRNYTISFCSEAIGKFLLSLGNYGTKNWNVPEFILEGNKKIKGSYLKAFFDDEGSFKENHTLKVMTINKNGMKQIKGLLNNLGIHCRLKPEKYNGFGEGTSYNITISHQTNIKKFCQEIGFGIKRKQEKLKNYLEKVNYRANEDEYEEVLKLRKEGGIGYRKIFQIMEKRGFIPHEQTISRWYRGEKIPYPNIYNKYFGIETQAVLMSRKDFGI